MTLLDLPGSLRLGVGRFCAALLAVLLLTALGATRLAAQGEGEPGLTLGRVAIAPDEPSVDTLCHLSVEVTNAGKQIASALDFDVRINGVSIDVYKAELFYDPIAAGETRVIELHNFWTTETHRPAPADGKLKVEVVLEAAQWMSLETSEEDGQKVETWTPLGAVAGLPRSVEIVVALGK